MAQLPNARYERKFVVEGVALAEVLALVQRHPAGFAAAYPPRSVNNVYLDTPGLAAYRDHVNGAPERTKTRVRWYGNWKEGSRLATLEHKFKSGALSGKTAYPLAEFHLNDSPPRFAVDRAFGNGNLPELARATVRELRPSLCNRYQRYYFLSADRRFRLTVDTELQFGPPENTLPLSGWPAIPMVVLELKFEPQHAEQAWVLTNQWPFRLARCSKYILGIARLWS